MQDKYLDNKFAYIYQGGGIPIREPSQMPLPIHCNPLSAEWQDGINKDCWWASGYTGRDKGGEKERQLIRKCLSFGGYEVCMSFVEEDADAILSRGQLWYGNRVQMMKGQPSQCHRNSAELWHNNKNRKLDNAYAQELALATGYALSSDGMWRQHSWCVLRTPRSCKIIETTVKRVAYFGFVMNEKEAERFVYENDW